MLYDIDGNSVSAIYDINGNAIGEPLPIDAVPSYFRADVQNALSYVNSLPSDYANYIMIADSHYNANNLHTFDIANYLFLNGNFDKMVHLGDLVEANNIDNANWQSAVDSGLTTLAGNWLWTQGNHDNGLNPVKNASDQFESKAVHYVSHSYRNAWYYDNKSAKIRIIGFHHYLSMASAIREEVKGWIDNLPSGYSWMTVCHYPFMTQQISDRGVARTSCMTEGNEQWLLGLIESKKSAYLGHYSGHLHSDTFEMWNGFVNANMDADLSRTGLAGTNREQTITIVSINPKNKNVKFYRIGRNEKHDSAMWELG